MGCGGSKQQDVATGNTVTRRLLRRSSSVAKGKRSEENGADDATEISGTAAAGEAKKAPPADGEPKLASRGSSTEEYFSSRREADSLDDVAAGTEVASDSLPGEHVDPNANVKAGEEAAGSTVSKKKDNETSAVVELEKEEEKEKDKEETTVDKEEEEEEDDGKSVGKLSADFKEALSLDEKEVEAPVIEKENTKGAKTTAEENNSGENKTAS